MIGLERPVMVAVARLDVGPECEHLDDLRMVALVGDRAGRWGPRPVRSNACTE